MSPGYFTSNPLPEKTTEDNPSTWTLATHTGNPDGVSAAWIQSGQDLAVLAMQGVNQTMKDPLSDSFFCHGYFQVNE